MVDGDIITSYDEHVIEEAAVLHRTTAHTAVELEKFAQLSSAYQGN
jgi:hypothetical protein